MDGVIGRGVDRAVTFAQTGVACCQSCVVQRGRVQWCSCKGKSSQGPEIALIAGFWLWQLAGTEEGWPKEVTPRHVTAYRCSTARCPRAVVMGGQAWVMMWC
jgi:hypothetical protein